MDEGVPIIQINRQETVFLESSEQTQFLEVRFSIFCILEIY